MEKGLKVATQKFIQTGNDTWSEDIEAHRKIMGIEMLPEDLDHTTAPVIFSYPASAQLAARIDGRDIDLDIIKKSTDILASRYDVVLVEGAGDFFTIDYVARYELPIILVTNGVLGSINHTILSLEAIRSRGIKLFSVIYNTFFDNDRIIAKDTREFIGRYVSRHFPDASFIEM